VTQEPGGAAAAAPPRVKARADEAGVQAVPEAQVAAAKAGAENFPVALRVLPRRYRRYLMAVYTFARTVDDVGDLAPAPDRMRLLGELADDVRRLYQDLAGPALTAEGAPQAAVAGLAGAIRDCKIPMQPFLDLIAANEQDQVVTRYQTVDELLAYCRLSANPVGRIVLYVFGCFSPERARLSDAICTGLQLTEHWQDVGEDLRAGRVYLPAADMQDYGCSEQDLAGRSAGPHLRRLMAFEAGRARDLIDEGAPLVGSLRGAARTAVAGYVAGGRAALAAIGKADYDVLSATPRAGKAAVVSELIKTLARGR
jgi:squalene synthase HpnC